MSFKPGRQFLHTPGPTAIPERVLNAMHRQAVDLADPDLHAVINRCIQGLQQVFRTKGDVFIYSANGHGGWEATMANLFVPGDRVLLPETGHFSASWAVHAQALGIEIVSLPGDGRTAIDPNKLEAALRADGEKRIKAVLAVQTDTASGVTSDVPALRAAIDAAGHPALFVVDAVASLGAAPFDMDAWGVDVAISASQKALMGPPGLAFLAASAKARAVAKATNAPKHYWDWTLREGPENYRRFCGTAPEHGLFGLEAALDQFFAEGLDAVIARHKRLAGAVQAAVAAWSEAGALSFNALVPAERSVSVTTIRTPEGFESGAFRDHLRAKRGVAVGGGLGAALSGKAFRIGHLGDLNEPMILGCLGAVELGLCDFKLPHESGLRAAIEHLAATA